MGMKKPELKYLTLPEFAWVWDERDQKPVIAYRADFRRQKTVTFVKGVLFNSADKIYVSEPFECGGYHDGLLLVNLDVTGQPTDIVIEIEFSDDSATWYKYKKWPFGDLRWEDAAGDKKESIDFPIFAPWIRLRVVSAGCAQGATFKLTSKVILNG